MEPGVIPVSRASRAARVMGGVTSANSSAGAPGRLSRVLSGKAASAACTPVPRRYQRLYSPSGGTAVSSPPSAQNIRFFSSRCLAASITSATTAEAVGSLPAPRP